MLALSLAACSGPGAGVGFVVNRTSGAASEGGQGKSYALARASWQPGQKGLWVLHAEEGSTMLDLAVPCEQPEGLLGRTVSLDTAHSHLRLEGQECPLGEASLNLQSVKDGLYRGNFNVHFGQGLEAVGNFEARR